MAKSGHDTTLDYVYRHVDPGGEIAERRAYEQTWFGNIAYYAGQQHFVSENGTIRLPRRLNPRKTHYKSNFVVTAVNRALAKLTQVNIEMGIAPKSPAWEDREAARTAMQVYDHLKRVTNFREKQEAAQLWAAICGSGYLKIVWDPFAGTPGRRWFDEQGNTVAFPSAIEQLEHENAGRFEDYWEGDVAIEVVSPFQFGWDWRSRDEGIEGCNYVWQRSAMAIDDLSNKYGSKVKDVTPMEVDSGAIRYEDAIATMTAVAGLNLGQYPQTIRGDRTTVIEWWERPARKNKWKGRYILIAGMKVIEDRDNPYTMLGCPIPWVKYDWLRMPGRFTGLSLVEHIRTPQKAYNQSRSVAYDIEQTHGWPLTVLDRKANIQRSKLKSLPGVILEGDMRQSPNPVHFMPQPNLPPFIESNADRALFEMNAISSQASPSKDQYPAGVRSSLAIQAVQEENNAILHPTAQSSARAAAAAGRIMLQIAAKRYEGPRLIQSVGRGGEFEVAYFSGANLRGHTELKMFGEPVRVETSTAYQERMIQMVEIGILQPQTSVEDRIAMLKAIDSKTADEIVNDQLLDERQEEKWLALAKRDVQSAMQRPPIGVEDAQVRIKVLERFMKTDQFWELNEEKRGIIQDRWQYWQQKIAEMIQAQLQMQEMMAGAQTSEPGQASRPKRSEVA